MFLIWVIQYDDMKEPALKPKNPAEMLSRSQRDVIEAREALAEAEEHKRRDLDAVDRWADNGSLAKEFGEAKAQLIIKRRDAVINYIWQKKWEEVGHLSLARATTESDRDILRGKIQKNILAQANYRKTFESIKPVPGKKNEPLSEWPGYTDIYQTLDASPSQLREFGNPERPEGIAAHDKFLATVNTFAVAKKGEKYFLVNRATLEPIKEIQVRDKEDNLKEMEAGGKLFYYEVDGVICEIKIYDA